MERKIVLLGVIAFFLAIPAYGQEWADKMFEVKTHDFGTVARYAKVEYEFIFTNLYVEDLHVADARASCGCTSVRIKNPLLKTFERGSIVATFNTNAFLGPHGATITVNIDQPFPAVVQLHVTGVIREDVVVNPPEVVLGDVDAGTPSERRIVASGRLGWQVVSVRSTNPHINAEVVRADNVGNQVNYELRVSLDKSAPVGYLKDHLLVTTNDPSLPQLPILVEGRVVSPITVSPSTWYIGGLQPGKKASKSFVVQGKKPFKILSVTGDGAYFETTPSIKSDEAKTLHVLTVSVDAKAKPGKAVENLQIKTDLNDTVAEVQAVGFITR